LFYFFKSIIFDFTLAGNGRDRAVVHKIDATLSESMFLETLPCRSNNTFNLMSGILFPSFGGNRGQSHKTNER
jgi:hypothetical protein